MSSESESNGPEDPTGLARVVADPGRSAGEKDRALRHLSALHQRLARMVLRRRGLRDESLGDEMAAEVGLRLLKGAFPAHHHDYAAWAWTVLSNYLTDQARRRRANELPAEWEAPDPSSGGVRENLEARLDWTIPFGAADRRRIAGWANPVRRIVLLCRGRLWRKAGAEDWTSWLDAAGVEGPFPPADYDDLEEQEQYDRLCATLDLTRNDFHQHWHRGKALLAELDFLRERLA